MTANTEACPSPARRQARAARQRGRAPHGCEHPSVPGQLDLLDEAGATDEREPDR